MIKFDFHTHTKYSHGSGTIMQNAISAKEKGIKGIAITDHGFNHPFFGMRRRKLDKMRAECIEAEKQTGVKVFLGTEANIIGLSGKTDLKPSDYDKVDVFLAGIHRAVFYDKFSDYFNFFGSNFITSTITKKPSHELIKRTTKAYINAIKNNPIDVLTHLNFLCFADSLEVAKCLADYGTYLEINTKKTHLTYEEWQNIIDKTKVNFVIDSDAHSPDRIGDTVIAEKLFERINFPLSRIHNIQDELPTLRFSQFKEKKWVI